MARKIKPWVPAYQNIPVIEQIKPDITPPSEWSKLNKGWLFNTYSLRIDHGCTSTSYHSRLYTHKTDAQQSVHLYSTKLLALEAMRADYIRQCCKKIEEIDEQIKAERKKPTPLPDTTPKELLK
jgi:hypothetical protein